MCYQLSLRKVDAQRVINWTAVGQLSWQYLRRSTALVYHSDRRSGQLATAGTCKLLHCIYVYIVKPDNESYLRSVHLLHF